MSSIEKDFVHLARLALDGRSEDVMALSRRVLRQIIQHRPDLASDARIILSRASHTPIREISQSPIPIDADSRLELLRREVAPQITIEPTWPPTIETQLHTVLREQDQKAELERAGIAPTRSMLFVGPPGVGKTLAARWLASKMERQILILDLAAVMSSFLGRTGNNIRIVLDYARSTQSILLLDEFDSIAKRRDDATDVGELKRLVTVLLQAIDEWPKHSLLLAATNHPELLDPAVWRRFDRVLEFPKPSIEEIRAVIKTLFTNNEAEKNQDMLKILAALMHGESFADTVRVVTMARRQAIVDKVSLNDALRNVAVDLTKEASLKKKLDLVSTLKKQGVSQRKISEMISVSRDTIRKYTR